MRSKIGKETTSREGNRLGWVPQSPASTWEAPQEKHLICVSSMAVTGVAEALH